MDPGSRSHLPRRQYVYTGHLTGRLRADDCPSGKHVYEEERFARNALRWQREHGEIRQAVGSIYRCSLGGKAHWHTTSTKRIPKGRK